nr:MAG TPA: hypothetical protein [Caudoviricetes sp.]
MGRAAWAEEQESVKKEDPISRQAPGVQGTVSRADRYGSASPGGSVRQNQKNRLTN